VLGRLGIELKEIDDWNCCGATAASKTDEFLGLALPARNLGLAMASGYDEVIVPCSECYSRMKVSQKALDEDPEFRASVNAELSRKADGHIRISSILDALAPLAGSGELAGHAVKSLKGLKPACYYGCLMTRFPVDMEIEGSVENPQSMELICEELGAGPIDWSYKTDCCGASASINDQEQCLLLMSHIIKDAVDRGANCFITTCPFCQLNLDAYQEKTGALYGIDKRLPVYFVTEVVGVALGLEPSAMQLERHIVDAEGLLKELKLI
jgi:heterodisulfide reductase subunit B